jgi:hypothetical protein
MLRESEYQRLLETLIEVMEANKGVAAGDDDRILDGEGLALKFFLHAASALYLYRGTSLPEFGANFIDPGSINVLCRAAIETFLTFHYVFVVPQSDADRNYRYMAWILGGYLERQKLPVWSHEGRAVLEREKGLIGPLTQKLKDNAAFRQLQAKEQKKLLNGKWRLQSWSDIGRSIGLNDVYAEAFYSYLCGYSHSGNLSVIQMRQANTAELQRSLCVSSMNVLLIAMANMVKGYCAVFPKAMECLAQDSEGARLVDVWIGVGNDAANLLKD